MEQILKTVDIDNYVGAITLSNGNVLKLPKVGMRKIIAIVKFIGVDGFKLWEQVRKIMTETDNDTFGKFALAIDSLKDEQLVKIQSILLDISEEEALNLDLNETLDIFIEYGEKTNLGKTYSQIQKLMKVMFKKDLPEFGALLDNWFPKKEDKLEEVDQLIKETHNQVPERVVTRVTAPLAGTISANDL
nr:hypothetical protein [Bacillus cereus]